MATFHFIVMGRYHICVNPPKIHTLRVDSSLLFSCALLIMHPGLLLFFCAPFRLPSFAISLPISNFLSFSPPHLHPPPSIAVIRLAGFGLLRRFHCSDVLSSGMYFCQLSFPAILLMFGTLLETRLRACAYVARLTGQRPYSLAATVLPPPSSGSPIDSGIY